VSPLVSLALTATAYASTVVPVARNSEPSAADRVAKCAIVEVGPFSRFEAAPTLYPARSNHVAGMLAMPPREHMPSFSPGLADSAQSAPHSEATVRRPGRLLGSALCPPNERAAPGVREDGVCDML
jgi:hypothetical protein